MQLIFGRGKTETDYVSKERLFVNNVGYYRDVTTPLEIERLNGRSDWHVIFVGDGVVRTNYGKAESGDVVLYRPGDCQRYVYEAGEKTLYFWAHFSGKEADGALKLPSGVRSCKKNAGQIIELFFRIVNAISDGGDSADKYATGLFLAICALMESGEVSRGRYGKVVSMMRDFERDYKLKDYAEVMGVSEGHFIRSFKKSTGKTPLEYRACEQIEYAKTLLIETKLKNKDVASLAGFPDALYFSRVFRKHTGLSPSKFRKQC